MDGIQGISKGKCAPILCSSVTVEERMEAMAIGPEP
jgi:hypothetical protein